MADMKVLIEPELDPAGKRKVSDEIVDLLGQGNKPGQAPQNSPQKAFLAEMEKLRAINESITHGLLEQTKAMREQVALREKELIAQKQMAQVSAPGGTQGGGGGGFFRGWQTIFGGDRRHLTRDQQRSLGLAESLGSIGSRLGPLMDNFYDTARGGFGTADTMRLISQGINSVPVLSTIAGGYTAGMDSIAKAADAQDQWRIARFQMFQRGGQNAMNSWTDLWDSQDGRELMVRNGITRDRSLQMETEALRSYGGNVGIQYAAEGRFGLGSETTQLMGALRRAGSSSSDGGETEFAEAMGVALATQLDRGRWGEAFTTLTRAAQGVLYGTVDISRIAAQQTLVGQLGAQYQGDTPQSQAMNAMLNKWGSGQGGGFIKTMALQEAMKATGGNYWKANMMVEAGLGSGRGMTQDMLKDMITRMPVAKAFFDGNMDADTAAGVLSAITGESHNRIYDLLIGMQNGAGQRTGPDNAAIIADTGHGAMPGVNIGPIQRAIKKSFPYTSKSPGRWSSAKSMWKRPISGLGGVIFGSKGFDQQGDIAPGLDDDAVPQASLGGATAAEVAIRQYSGSIPLHFMRALAQRESGMDPSLAKDGSGAGLFQITGPARNEYNRTHGTNYTRKDTLDPAINTQIATSTLQAIVKAYGKHSSQNMKENWNNPEFVEAVVAGWNAGYAEKGGVGQIVSYLEKNNIPVTAANIWKHAQAAGAVPKLSQPKTQNWAHGVTNAATHDAPATTTTGGPVSLHITHEVHVSDTRVAVSSRAGRTRNHGAPGQNYTRIS